MVPRLRGKPVRQIFHQVLNSPAVLQHFCTQVIRGKLFGDLFCFAPFCCSRFWVFGAADAVREPLWRKAAETEVEMKLYKPHWNVETLLLIKQNKYLNTTPQLPTSN